MRFKDVLDSNNIEYNNPYARERIREYNKYKDELGEFYDNDFNVGNFCLDLLDKFFPLLNGIWCDSHHFVHVTVLELTRICLEYGFFKSNLLYKISCAMVKVCQSLRKLEDAWNDKMEKDEEEHKEEMRAEILKNYEMENKYCSTNHISDPDESSEQIQKNVFFSGKGQDQAQPQSPEKSHNVMGLGMAGMLMGMNTAIP